LPPVCNADQSDNSDGEGEFNKSHGDVEEFNLEDFEKSDGEVEDFEKSDGEVEEFEKVDGEVEEFQKSRGVVEEFKKQKFKRNRIIDSDSSTNGMHFSAMLNALQST